MFEDNWYDDLSYILHIITRSITTLSIMTLSIMTFSMMTLSIDE